MAIDDAEKRRSVVGVHYYMAIGVTPNAAKDEQWRTQAGYSYSGLIAEAGQPFMVRSQGVPTGSGSRDRVGRWN